MQFRLRPLHCFDEAEGTFLKTPVLLGTALSAVLLLVHGSPSQAATSVVGRAAPTQAVDALSPLSLARAIPREFRAGDRIGKYACNRAARPRASGHNR